MRGGGPTSLATSLSGGNQQKCVIAREIACNPRVLVAAQPTRGLDVGAIEFVHRRLVAERDAGRGILLVSLEFEEVRSLADRILVIYEGEIVGEFPPDVVRGGARHRDDRRRAPARGRTREPPSDPVEPPAGQALAGEAGPEAAATTPAARLAAYVQGGGVIVPLLTAVLAFFVGGLVILVTGHNPISTYKAIFNGTGLNWFFPWIVGRRPHDRGAEPPADADHHHAADPHRPRGGVRLPLRAVQHRRPGPVPRRLLRRGLGGLVVRRHAARCCTSCSRSSLATLAGAVWAGIAGLLKATVGAHEVISTIMLNWIAIWVGAYLFGSTARCRTPTRRSRRCRSPTTSWPAPSCPVFWGDPELQGLHIGIFIALARRCSSSGCC